MSMIQTLFRGSVPAPAAFPRAPIVEVPTNEANCAGSTCGLPLNKRSNGANQMVYDCVEVGGVKFHDMRCMSASQKEQYIQETKARTEQRERDARVHDVQVRAERIEMVSAQLALLKSETGKAQIAALGFPYAFALEFVQQNLDFLQGKILNAPRLTFDTSYSGYKTENARAGKTIRT